MMDRTFYHWLIHRFSKEHENPYIGNNVKVEIIDKINRLTNMELLECLDEYQEYTGLVYREEMEE